MNKIVYARKLWINGGLVIDQCLLAFDCGDLHRYAQNAKNVWLVPTNFCVPNIDYVLSLAAPSPYPEGTLQGVWVPDATGEGYVLNVLSLGDLIAACQECCGETSTLLPRYNSLPVPYTPPELIEYTFMRTDAGDVPALGKAMMDYYGQYQVASFYMVSHDAGTGMTTYKFKAFTPPTFLSTDQGASGNTFFSNTLPELSTPDQEYQIQVTADSQSYPNVYAATIPDMLDYLNNTSPYAGMGQWTYDAVENVLQLESTTVFSASITVNAASVTKYASNEADVPLPPDSYYNFSLTLNGSPVGTEIENKLTLAAILQAISLQPDYVAIGSYSIDGDTIVLTTDQAGMDVTLEIGLMDAVSYHSNVAPADDPDKVYRLLLNVNSDEIEPPITGNTLAQLVMVANGSNVYSVYGSYSQASNIVTLISNHAPPITLNVTQVTESLFQSNAAPAFDATKEYNLAITINGIIFGGNIRGGTLQEVVDAANSNTQGNTNQYGTWSTANVSGSNYIFLSSSTVFSAGLVVSQVAATAYNSNEAPSKTTAEVYTLTAVINGNINVVPVITGLTGLDLANTAQATDEYNDYGNWTYTPSHVILHSSRILSASLTIGKEAAPIVYSNFAPPKTDLEFYHVNMTGNDATGAPVPDATGEGSSLQTIVEQFNATDYPTYGLWINEGGTRIGLQSGTVKNIVIVITVTTGAGFTSNTAPAFTINKQVTATITPISPSAPPTNVTGATVDVVLQKILADPTLSTYGSWSVVNEQLNLLSGSYDDLTLVLAASTGFVNASNTTAAPGPGESYSITLAIDGNPIPTQMLATTLAALVSAMNLSYIFSCYGLYTQNGTQVSIESATNNNLELTLSTATDYPETKVSNSFAAPSPGNVYRLTVTVGGNPIAPTLIGYTAQMVIAQANMNALYNVHGFYSLNGTTIQLVTLDASITLVVAVIAAAAAPFPSNAITPPPTGNINTAQFNLNDIQWNSIGRGGITTMVRMVAVYPYVDLGTWSSTSTTITLTTNQVVSNGNPVINNIPYV